MKPLVVTIGTTDPWNAAGVGLDVRVLEACGARALLVVAGVSAQDRHGLSLGRALDPEAIEAQLASLRSAPIAAYRVGALLDAASVRTVAAALADASVPIVYDPVLGPSSGGAFADPSTLEAIVQALLPRVTLVTPNAGEAARLTGSDDPLEAARALVAAGARAALVTEGDRAPSARDTFVDDAGTIVFEEPHIAGGMRGTGCVLAAAAAAALARGLPMREAVAHARAFVRARIADAVDIGGMRVMA